MLAPFGLLRIAGPSYLGDAGRNQNSENATPRGPRLRMASVFRFLIWPSLEQILRVAQQMQKYLPEITKTLQKHFVVLRFPSHGRAGFEISFVPRVFLLGKLKGSPTFSLKN